MSNEMKLKEKREKFESLLQSWNGTEMWFQERRLHFPGEINNYSSSDTTLGSWTSRKTTVPTSRCSLRVRTRENFAYAQF